MIRKWRPRFAGLAITLVTALAATVGSASPAGAATIPVTGTAEGTAHMEWTGTFDPGECHFYGNFTLTITSGPLAGGTLHHDVCWSLPDGELYGGNHRASLALPGAPPDGTFYSGELTSFDPTACNGDPDRRGCGQTGDWLSDTRTVEFFDRVGGRFGRATKGELTLHVDSTLLDPMFYDGTFDADLSVSAILSGQLHD